MKTALHQDAKKGSWKVMGGSQLERMRRVPHHRGSISAVSSLPFFLLLTCQLVFFVMLEKKVSLGKSEVPENYLEARVGASPLLHSLSA